MTLMAADFPKFFATAAELYDLWPSLFHWAAGVIGTIAVGLVTASWWMRGYIADRNEARIRGTAEANEARIRGTAEANEAALKGQIGILEQRLALATEQQTAAKGEAEGFKNKLDELLEKVAHNAPPEDVRRTVMNLEVQLGKALAANNATTTTLTAPLPLPARLRQFGDDWWLTNPASTTGSQS
jgi:hypothetical protein